MEKNNTPKKYRTVQQAADEMEVSPPKVRRMIDDGLIEAYRFGPRKLLIPADALQRFVADSRMAPKIAA
jgi:excisionase family DNA binding protein